MILFNFILLFIINETILGFKYYNNVQYLKNGSKMGRKWVENGSKMGRKWVEKWLENGSKNAYL
jgi:hypothetical protein